MKKALIILFLLCTIIARGQSVDYGFKKMAVEQEQAVEAAYYKKDVVAAQKCMDMLLGAYNKLTVAEKSAKENKSYITEAYYNLACTYAATGNKKKALDNLERSNYTNYDHLQEDHDLVALHKDPRFIKFAALVKSRRTDPLSVLQRAPAYNKAEKSDIPPFTYQSVNDPNLIALKKAFNLDSIAGKGSDASQAINLMHWVHNLIPHDGSKGNPAVKNAMSLITECKRDHKTLNCRGLAILLNEVYLAEGFKSRMVTCMPQDTADNDCHVIDMVYANDLKKWIWMDPTFNAYVMNEKGELLGLGEVRERLIKGQTLIINPDADHNHENSETKRYYLDYYMAKNLYKLECPLSSEYNYETREAGKQIAYIKLIPGGASLPKPESSTNSLNVKVFTTYYTANPDLFWATPPGQRKEDFEATIAKFKQFYNNNQADSICNMFSDDWGEMKKTLWPAKEQKSIREEYGDMISYKYMGPEPEDGVILFKVRFSKSTHAMGLSLEKDGQMGTFRFKTSSGFINDMLAKY